MKNKPHRTLKVYNQSQNGKYNIPTIILKGEWLKQLGFDINKEISVICDESLKLLK